MEVPNSFRPTIKKIIRYYPLVIKNQARTLKYFQKLPAKITLLPGGREEIFSRPNPDSIEATEQEKRKEVKGKLLAIHLNESAFAALFFSPSIPQKFIMKECYRAMVSFWFQRCRTVIPAADEDKEK